MIPLLRRRSDWPAFAGILDSLSAAALGAWSEARALYTDKAGTNIVRLRRDSDNAESDFAADASGDLDAAAVTAWAAGANLFAVTSYDQSGNGNHLTMATAGTQPPFSLTAVGGKPGLLPTTGDKYLSPASSTDFNGLMTGGCAVHNVIKPTTTTGYLFGKDGGGRGLQLSFGTNKLVILQDGSGAGDSTWTADVACSTGTVYAETWNHDGTMADDAVTWRSNGAPRPYTGNNPGGTLQNDSLALRWGSGFFAASMPGGHAEFIIFPTPLSAGDLQTLNDDATTYYGA